VLPGQGSKSSLEVKGDHADKYKPLRSRISRPSGNHDSALSFSAPNLNLLMKNERNSKIKKPSIHLSSVKKASKGTDKGKRTTRRNPSHKPRSASQSPRRATSHHKPLRQHRSKRIGRAPIPTRGRLEWVKKEDVRDFPMAAHQSWITKGNGIKIRPPTKDRFAGPGGIFFRKEPVSQKIGHGHVKWNSHKGPSFDKLKGHNIDYLGEKAKMIDQRSLGPAHENWKSMKGPQMAKMQGHNHDYLGKKAQEEDHRELAAHKEWDKELELRGGLRMDKNIGHSTDYLGKLEEDRRNLTAHTELDKELESKGGPMMEKSGGHGVDFLGAQEGHKGFSRNNKKSFLKKPTRKMGMC